jgi:hypothetical protein
MVAGTGQAQEVNVTTGSTSAKLGGEFRGELIYDDNGLMKTKGNDPDATTDIQVTAANVTLDGKINPDTDYSFEFNLLGNGKPLTYGYGTHWFSKTIGFSIGRQKVLQGGFDNIDGDYDGHVIGAYASNLVFSEFADMIGFHVKAGGDITVQILDDVQGDWNTKAKQTFVLGWRGEFGPIMPMVNIGSYDNNKSNWFDIGVKTKMNALTASLDIYMNSMSNKYADPADAKKNKDIKDTASAYTLKVAYEIKGTATPWFYFSTYDTKEGTDSNIAARKEERKVNSMTTDASTGATTYNWDDNGMTWGLGANLHMMGKGWSPFIAILSHSGKWADPADATKEETKSNMMIKLGALGEI